LVDLFEHLNQIVPGLDLLFRVRREGLDPPDDFTSDDEGISQVGPLAVQVAGDARAEAQAQDDVSGAGALIEMLESSGRNGAVEVRGGRLRFEVLQLALSETLESMAMNSSLDDGR
jgi:hypothetical protein